MKLTDATHAFITGGASGIGLAIGDALAARGLAVTLADIDGDALAAVVAERGAKAAGRIAGIRLDVRDREGWARARAEAEARFGPVDILVNNAGLSPDGTAIADMSPEAWERHIGINLTGVFNGISIFGPAIRAGGRGHIVNTASMAGIAPMFEHAGLGPYAAMKSAVVVLSEALRTEMAPHGVGVSVLCPGMVATNLNESSRKLSGLPPTGEVSILQQRGIPAAEVGEIVAAAIEANDLYIVTHKDRLPYVDARQSAIRAAFL